MQNSEHGIGAASSAQGMYLSSGYPKWENWQQRSREMKKERRHELRGRGRWIDGSVVSSRKKRRERTINKKKTEKVTKERKANERNGDKQTQTRKANRIDECLDITSWLFPVLPGRSLSVGAGCSYIERS
jgi:hypothetical protein